MLSPRRSHCSQPTEEMLCSAYEAIMLSPRSHCAHATEPLCSTHGGAFGSAEHTLGNADLE